MSKRLMTSEQSEAIEKVCSYTLASAEDLQNRQDGEDYGALILAMIRDVLIVTEFLEGHPTEVTS